MELAGPEGLELKAGVEGTVRRQLRDRLDAERGVLRDLDVADGEPGSSQKGEAHFADFYLAPEGCFEGFADAFGEMVGAEERRRDAGYEKRGQSGQQPSPGNSAKVHLVSSRRL